MPDGDHIYGTLNQAFEGVYQALCEGTFDASTNAHDFVDPMRQSLKRLGDAPLALLREVVHLCQQLPGGFFAPTNNWRQLQRDIERLARFTQGTKKGVDIALDVATRHLLALREGLESQSSHVLLVRAYIERVYKAEFEERLPLEHGIDEQLFSERLTQARFYLSTTFDGWAEHAVRSSSFANFRNPLRSLVPVNADTDLLAIR